MGLFRKIQILIAGILVLVVVSWATTFLVIKVKGPSWVVDQLKKFNVEATIGSAKTNYLNKISFRDIQVTSPLQLSVKKAQLSFSLQNIFVLNKAVFNFDLYEPTGEIRPLPHSDKPAGSAGKLRLLPVSLNIHNGHFTVFIKDVPYDLSQIHGDVAPQLLTIRARIKGILDNSGLVESTLHLSMNSVQTWTAEVKSSGVDVLPLSQKQPFIPKDQILSGKADVIGRAKGEMRPEFILKDWNVNVNGKNMLWEHATTKAKVPFSINAQLDPEQCAIKSLQMFEQINGKGVIKKPWSDSPQVKMSLEGQQFDTALILKGLKKLAPRSRWEIPTSIECELEGELKNPAVSGKFEIAPAYGKLKFPDLSGEIGMDQEQIRLTAQALSGQIEFLGSLRSDQKELSILSVKNISISQWAKENGWTNVGGNLSTKMEFDRTASRPQLNGNFQVKEFQWGRNRQPKDLDGTLSIIGETLTMVTADNSLLLKGSLLDSGFQLDEFYMDFGDGSFLKAQGPPEGTPQDSFLIIQAKKISPDVWPPLVKRYPDITGTMNMDGNLNGSFSDPSYDMAIAFEKIRFIPEGKEWDGTAHLTGVKNDFRLEDIRTSGGYQGSLIIQNKPSATHIKTELGLDHADPQFLSDILKSKEVFAGDLVGQANLEYDGKDLVGSSSVTWNAPLLKGKQYDELELNVEVTPNKIEFRNVSLSDQTQALRIRADSYRQAKGWSFDGVIQVQHWGTEKSYLDGEVNGKGMIDFKEKTSDLQLTSSLLWWNDLQLDNLNASLKVTPQKWEVKGRLFDRITGVVSANRISGKMRGEIDGKNFPIEDIFQKGARLDPDECPKGLSDFVTSISGTVSDPKVVMNIKLKSGVWRDEAFESEALLEINSSTLTLTTAQMNLRSGGILYLQGYKQWGAEGHSHFKGTGEDIPLGTLVHFMRWPVKWDGVTQMSFQYNQSSTTRLMEVTVDGEHNGFGPFKEGGALQGVVRGSGPFWDLSSLYVESGEGYVRLLKGSELYLDKDESGRMRFVSDVRNIRSGPLTFFGTTEVAGTWRKIRSPEGVEDDMLVDMDVFARPLWINQFPLEGNVTHLTLKKGEVSFSPIVGGQQQISGSLVYKDFPKMEVKDLTLSEDGKEKLYLSGLIGPEEWDFQLKTNDIDANIIRGIFDTTLPITGLMDLNIKGKGSLTQPNISGTVAWKNGTLSFLPVDNAQCEVRYKNNVVRITNIVAQKKRGYQLNGYVNMAFPADKSDPSLPDVLINIEKGDLAFLPEFWPEVKKAKGNFKGRLRIGPSREGRTISGFFNVEKMSLTSAHIPSLENGQINIEFVKNRLLVQNTSAKVGKGTVSMGGWIDFKEGAVSEYNLAMKTTSTNGISLRVPELAISPGPVLGKFKIFKNRLAGISRGEAKLDLKLAGPVNNPVFSGDVELENTVFTYPPSPLTEKEEPSDITRKWEEFFASLNWDLNLHARDRVWYQNELVDAKVTGDINFKGTAQSLRTQGQIRSDQGSIIYSGNEFSLKEAQLDIETKRIGFEEPPILQTAVYLRARAEREVFYSDGLSSTNQDIIVMVVDRSLLGEIQPRFYSKNNPNLSQKRALQLALGMSFDDSIDDNSLLPDQRGRAQTNQEETDKMLRTGLVQLLDSTLASPLARAIAQRTGLVDFIRVTFQEKDPLSDTFDPNNPTESNSTDVTQNEFLRYAKGTKVKFGRGLSSRLFADYSFRVDEFQQKVDLRHEVELAYRVHRNLFLKGTTELDRERTLGRPPDRRAVLENQWRFGLPRPKKKTDAAAPSPAPSPVTK